MDPSDFDYDLPLRLIAQEPRDPRDSARLLVVRRDGSLEDRSVLDLPKLLPDRSFVILNDTRVIPARLFGRKPSGGRVEILLVRPCGGYVLCDDPDSVGVFEERAFFQERWEVMLRPMRRLRPGMLLRLESASEGGCCCGSVPDCGVTVEIVSLEGAKGAEAVFRGAGTGLLPAVEGLGSTPLPPYIRRPDGASPKDRVSYQTVFAKNPGAVAAPTAGLHFTNRLLEGLASAGHELGFCTLHVGPGTFQPVKTARVEDHVMHLEWFRLPAAVAKGVLDARAQGRKVVAVGTTTVRVLETCARLAQGLAGSQGLTDLFILPGFDFRITDIMLTNFHLPRSTLLMLVSAFAGTRRILDAYSHAVQDEYRFYSYGDAMLLFKTA